MTAGSRPVQPRARQAQLVRDERDRHGEHPLSLLIAPVVALQRRELPLGRLVDAGALYRIRKGEYAYTAPKFRDYLLRRASD